MPIHTVIFEWNPKHTPRSLFETIKPQSIVTQAKNDCTGMGVLASVPTFNQKHRRMIFFSHSTTGFLTKCYRNICCSDNRDVKANNVSTVQAFSWVCRVLPLLLNLFIFSAQEISEKGEEAEEVRRCSIRGHRGEVKIKERFGSFFSGSNSSYCMMLPLSYHACHLLFTQFVSHPQ